MSLIPGSTEIPPIGLESFTLLTGGSETKVEKHAGYHSYTKYSCTKISYHVSHLNYGKCSKISNTFLLLLSNKMFIGDGIYKMHVRKEKGKKG